MACRLPCVARAAPSRKLGLLDDSNWSRLTLVFFLLISFGLVSVACTLYNRPACTGVWGIAFEWHEMAAVTTSLHHPPSITRRTRFM